MPGRAPGRMQAASSLRTPGPDSGGRADAQPGGPERGRRSPRSPPMSTSKKTRGFLGLEGLAAGDGCAIFTAGTGEQDAGSTCATGGQILQHHCVRRGQHAGNATSGTASEAVLWFPLPPPCFRFLRAAAVVASLELTLALTLPRTARSCSETVHSPKKWDQNRML